MILFVAKRNSQNFIENYTSGADQYAPGSRLFIPTGEPGPDGSRWAAQVEAVASQGNYDTIIFEWANDLTAACLSHSYRQKIIVRVHDHEVRTGRIHKIPWWTVDRVWCINRQVMEQFREETGGKVDTFFLPNAVNPEPFTEHLSSGKKIGLLSIYARKRKRLDRAVELMECLPDWTLYIRTEGYTPEQDGYFDEVLRPMIKAAKNKNIVMDLRADYFTQNGYPRDDVNDFFHDKSVVISTSEHEGFHYTLAEGALCGCMPVVFNWEYGRPRDFWKPFVCHSVKTMAAMIETYNPSPKYRQYVIDNYSPAVLWPKLLEEIR